MKILFMLIFISFFGCVMDSKVKELRFDSSLEDVFILRPPLERHKMMMQPSGERVMQLETGRDTVLFWNRYISLGNKISFSLPSDFVTEKDSRSLGAFNRKSYDNDFFSITVNLKSSELKDVWSYNQLLTDELKKDSFEVVNSSAYKNAFRSIFQIEVVNDLEVNQSLFILVTESKNNIFDFTMSFTGDRELGRSIFLNIMASLFFDDSSLIGYDANLEEVELGFLKE